VTVQESGSEVNRLRFSLKYTEYLFKIARCFIFTDEWFHARKIWKVAGYFPDLNTPVTLNEKICYRMMYDCNPLYTLVADKLAVREYIKTRTNRLHLVPLLGVWEKVGEIEWDRLPDKFVLKCNHDSGSVVICRDRRKFDFSEARLKLGLAMKKNMYYQTREWQYKISAPRYFV